MFPFPNVVVTVSIYLPPSVDLLYFYHFGKKNRIVPRQRSWTSGVVSGFLPGGGRDTSRVCRKSPRGWRKNCALPPSPQRFLLSHTTLLIYAHFFDILDICCKEIHKIYFLKTFSFCILSFIRKLGYPQHPRFRRG